MMLQLKIQTHSSLNTIEVDPQISVGAFLLSFVKRMGYPPMDARGAPLDYRLRLAPPAEHVLPSRLSFAELQIPPGSVLVLNVPESQRPTLSRDHKRRQAAQAAP